MVNMVWVKDPVSAWMPGYRRWVDALHEYVGEVIRSFSTQIEEWMKTNAPFSDVTGAARRSLHVELEEYLEGYLLRFLYSIPIYYAVYLEYDHQGKFAILEPALNYWGPVILDAIRAGLR